MIHSPIDLMFCVFSLKAVLEKPVAVGAEAASKVEKKAVAAVR